jgi:hypothetical protein
LRRFLLVLLFLLAGAGFSATAQERVALVVGNSAYEHVPSLRNPRNDAEDLTRKLEGLGFTVVGGVDLDRRKLVESLIKFGRAAERAEVALFFYAGHGLQVNGQNYLVPVDAMVEFESEIDLSLVSLSGVMQQLERGSRTNLVFLDACRDNPFAKDLAGARTARPPRCPRGSAASRPARKPSSPSPRSRMPWRPTGRGATRLSPTPC